ARRGFSQARIARSATSLSRGLVASSGPDKVLCYVVRTALAFSSRLEKAHSDQILARTCAKSFDRARNGCNFDSDRRHFPYPDEFKSWLVGEPPRPKGRIHRNGPPTGMHNPSSRDYNFREDGTMSTIKVPLLPLAFTLLAFSAVGTLKV